MTARSRAAVRWAAAPAPAHVDGHALDCPALAQPPGLDEGLLGCDGSCNPAPEYDRVQLVRVQVFEVPIPRTTDRDAAELAAWSHLAGLPNTDHDEYLVDSPLAREDWTALEVR